MTWSIPALPRADYDSKVAYWNRMLQIPDDEPSSEILKAMAVKRLVELKVLTRDPNSGSN